MAKNFRGPLFCRTLYISSDRVNTHLQCGGIYNNQIIANCPQSVPVKKF